MKTGVRGQTLEMSREVDCMHMANAAFGGDDDGGDVSAATADIVTRWTRSGL